MADAARKSNPGAAYRDPSGRVARYFSKSSGQLAGGSNFGAMCERLGVYVHASVRCRACGGSGVRELSAEDLIARQRRLERTKEDNLAGMREALRAESVCRVCKGTGYQLPSKRDRKIKHHPMFTTVRCGRCKGTAETLSPNDESAERGDVCLDCLGDGYLVPITVRPVGSSKHGKPPPRVSDGDDVDLPLPSCSQLDEDELVEYGRVSRVLGIIRRATPELAAALEVYYGPDGDRWGGHKWGRAFALWPLTSAGQKLASDAAERSRRGHGFLMAPLDLLANERDAELRTKTPNVRRRSLLRQADSQARMLCDAAHAAFAQAEGAVS